MFADYNNQAQTQPAQPTAADFSRPLTPAQLAERLQMTPQTLRTWRSQGKGPKWFNIGVTEEEELREIKGAVRYRMSAVVEWEQEMERLTQGKVDRKLAVRDGETGATVEVSGPGTQATELCGWCSGVGCDSCKPQGRG